MKAWISGARKAVSVGTAAVGALIVSGFLHGAAQHEAQVAAGVLAIASAVVYGVPNA